MPLGSVSDEIQHANDNAQFISAPEDLHSAFRRQEIARNYWRYCLHRSSPELLRNPRGENNLKTLWKLSLPTAPKAPQGSPGGQKALDQTRNCKTTQENHEHIKIFKSIATPEDTRRQMKILKSLKFETQRFAGECRRRLTGGS